MANTHKSVGINAILNSLRQICSVLFPVITLPYISRVLGSENYGVYQFSFSITNYFLLLAALGISTYASREGSKIRDNRIQISNFCNEIFTINIVSMGISLIAFVCIVVFTPFLEAYQTVLLIQGMAILIATLGADWVNVIFEDYLYITVRYIIIQIISILLLFIFVRSRDDLIPYTVITLFATFGGNFINILYIRRYVHLEIALSKNCLKHLKPILIMFFSAVCVIIYVNSDITMLGYYTDNISVGIYSFSTKIYAIFKSIINAGLLVTLPRLSYYIKHEYENYDTFLDIIIRTMTLVLLPVAGGILGLRRELITILGGEEYLSGTPVLMVLCFALVFAIYGSYFGNCVLIANNKEKECLIAGVVSASLNVILNLLLLPYFGIVGAAITTLIAEIVSCAVQYIYAKGQLKINKLVFKDLVYSIVGAALCVLMSNLSREILPGEEFVDQMIRVVGVFLSFVVFYFALLRVGKNETMNYIVGMITKKSTD